MYFLMICSDVKDLSSWGYMQGDGQCASFALHTILMMFRVAIHITVTGKTTFLHV